MKKYELVFVLSLIFCGFLLGSLPIIHNLTFSGDECNEPL